MKQTIRLIKKGVGAMVAILVLGAVIVLLLNSLIVIKARPNMFLPHEVAEQDHSNQTAPYLVLGAGVIDNQQPSRILKKRLDAVELIDASGSDGKYIMSGDHREDNYNEVAVMKRYLVDQGVDSQTIYLDHAGYSTYESLYRLKHVFGIDEVYIVTQAYHLPRALMIADHLGIEATGVIADEVDSTRIKREVREVAARMKDFMVCQFNLDPHLEVELDYPIDLNQSGDLTNGKQNLTKK